MVLQEHLSQDHLKTAKGPAGYRPPSWAFPRQPVLCLQMLRDTRGISVLLNQQTEEQEVFSFTQNSYLPSGKRLKK